MTRKVHLASSLLAGASMLTLASLAYAQTPATAAMAVQGATVLQDSQDSEPEAEIDEGAQAVDDIVVTGSRIVRNGNNSPTPVTVVSTQELLTTTPSTVVQALQELPVFSGGRSPTTQPGNSSQNNSARVLNLRNVGITRTLVLFDGRRVPPTSATGEVNADFVPSMLLDRVDVVTGGASAVYGSDAVAGVVNFVTDRDYNGLKIDGHYGVSRYGDGEEYKFGIAGGMDVLGDRGHLMGSYEYFNSPGIFTKLDREFGKLVYTVQGAGTAANPYRLVQNSRLNQTSFFGLIRSGPLADRVFRTNGVLSPFQHGTPTGASTVESGGDGGYFYNASLQSQYQSDLLYGRFDYDLTDKVRFFAQANYMQGHNNNNHETTDFRNVTMSSRNAFLDPVYQATMTPAQTFTFSKLVTQAPPKSSETFNTSHMAFAGFEGELGDWRWDISYVNSRNEQATQNNSNPNNMKLSAALDAVKAADGSIVCNVTLTNPGLYPGCVPLNLFGPTSESLAALDYVLDVTRFVATTEMNNIGGTITGSPFSLPAGDFQTAFSFEWRKLTYELVSNAQPNPATCTGLRYNCGATTLIWQSNVRGDRTPVSQTVSEVAMELEAPVVRDLPFMSEFTLNGAVRYTDYDTSGAVTTWKVGGDWVVNDSLRFRATRSRDIRAPNLNDLYAPRLVNPAGATDVHTGIVGQSRFITDPNPNLKPEEADTLTVGMVLRPSSIPRLSLSLDYYDIEIGNAIVNIQSQNITIQNICEASNGASSFCALIERPLPFSDRSAANFATAFYSRPENAQTLTTKGIDIEANYSVELWGGTLSARLFAAYQPELITVQFVGQKPQDSAGAAGLPELRVTTFLKYQIGDWSFDARNRWNSSTRYNSDEALIYENDHLNAYHTTNVTVSYDLNKTNLFFTVSNLFDRQPTPYGAVGGPSGVPGLFGGFLPGEDTVGRFFTAGFRYRF
jgi:outer membrane receptor protein involved in Fe transport